MDIIHISIQIRIILIKLVVRPYTQVFHYGRAKSTSAQFYVEYELDKMAEEYKEAWQRFGVNTDDLAII